MANNYDEMIHSSSSDYDENTSSSNYIAYGPIRFFARKRKAPTLSTGRKSKFEELQGEELIRREYRREKNRLLSKKLKEKRESIENELTEQINQLEREHEELLNRINKLQFHRNYLYRKLEEVQHDPLFSLIYRSEVTLFFEEYDHSSFDTMSLIATLTEQ